VAYSHQDFDYCVRSYPRQPVLLIDHPGTKKTYFNQPAEGQDFSIKFAGENEYCEKALSLQTNLDQVEFCRARDFVARKILCFGVVHEMQVSSLTELN
jgi:hypothetical protein